MDRILQYEEINSENKSVNHKFICICPTSSNMISSQKKKIDPNGLTLVGFINRDIFKHIFDDLEGKYNFKKTIHTHITMLGLFDEDRKLNPYYEKLTIDKINQFFQDKKKYNIKEYKIKFKHIRPGTYYKSNCNKETKDNTQPLYMLSNGTVIGIGDMIEGDLKKFRQDSLVYIRLF